VIEKAYIVVVTNEQRPAVARVHVIGSRGDWRLVQSAPYRHEAGGFEFALHSRDVHHSWIAAWRKAKATARRLRKISAGWREQVFLHLYERRMVDRAVRSEDCLLCIKKERISMHSNECTNDATGPKAEGPEVRWQPGKTGDTLTKGAK